MKTFGKITLAAVVLLGATTPGFSQPIFTRQPVNPSVSSGANVSFSALATSTNPPLMYQWQFTATNLAAQCSSRLSLTNVQHQHQFSSA